MTYVSVTSNPIEYDSEYDYITRRNGFLFGKLNCVIGRDTYILLLFCEVLENSTKQEDDSYIRQMPHQNLESFHHGKSDSLADVAQRYWAFGSPSLFIQSKGARIANN